MKRAVLHGLAGLGALVILAVAAPFLLPASIYKGRIEDSITHATGRKLTIAGHLHFALFPTFAIRADQVSLANIPGGHAPSIAVADDIRFGVQIWPLLSGRLELTRVVLDRPVISLESEADGRANWIFKHTSHTSFANHRDGSIKTQFPDIEIVSGSVSYQNFQTNNRRSIEDVNAKVRFSDLNRVMHAEGIFTSNSRRMAFKSDAAIPSSSSAANAHTTKIEIALSSDVLSAKFGGMLSQNGSVDGNVELRTPVARDAGTWLGASVPNIKGLGALSLSSHLDSDNRTVQLHSLKATLDGMSVGGDLSIDTRDHVPRIEGALRIDHLNLNPYVEHVHRQSVHHLHSRDDEWSSEPVALDVLKAVDAQLSISAGDVSVRKLKLGATNIRVDLAAADLKCSLDPMSLYGGMGKAYLHVDARRSAPYFHNTVEIRDIALQSFLSDTIGVKHIEGTGTIKLDVASTGTNANAIMHGMSGNGAIAFRDGHMRGVDLGAVARTIQSLLGTAISSDAVTAYTTMGGRFTARNGVLSSQDFQFAGPLLTAKGAGTVDIGNRAIDFRIVPQASALIAKQKLTVGLPFRITGPWKHLRYRADLNGLVKGVIENLESGKAPFKGLFGPPKPKDPNAPKKKHKSVEDALKNMLGIH